MLETAMNDLRFAARVLRKSPVFTLVAVLCISIGSGAVTTIFSAMNALVLRPVPGAADGGALIRMERKRPGGKDGISASHAFYRYLRDRTHTLKGVAAWGKASLTVRVGDDPGVAVYGNFVTGNFFGVLGVRPVLGRFFLAEEDRTELTHPVIVVSEGLWRTRFGADPGVIGKSIGVNGHPYTIVGVAPAAFRGLDAPITTDAWVPMMMQAQLRLGAGALASPGVTWLRLCGRLADGVSLGAAHRELAALTASYSREVGESGAARTYTDLQLSRLTGLPPDASGPLAAFLGLLLGAAALVLLIASVNVASMLSARAIARRREMAVRAALGAARGRLVRQLLTEILVLFVIGAVGGTAIAVAATASLERLSISASLPISLELSPDLRVLTFALGISLLTGLIFGLAPALQATDKDIAARVRDGSTGSGTRRTPLSNALVVGQMALSLLLLVSAGLFLRALDRGNRVESGFDASGVATAAFNAESWGYDEVKGRAFYAALRDRVAALPGVTSVSYAAFLPLTLQSNGTNVEMSGGDGRDPSAGNSVRLAKVDADYFAALRIPLVAGRAFTSADDARSPTVAIVNETLARRFYPKQSPVGRTIGYHGDRVTIIGVSRDAKYSSLTEDMPPLVFLALAQNWESKQTLIVRTAADPLALGPAIDAAVRSLDPGLPRTATSTLRSQTGIVLVPQRVAAIVTGVLGGVGLLLATIGLYGVIAYSSTRRRHEIGIRLALGARSADVLRMIVRDGMRLTVAGVAIGLVLAALATRLLAKFLFGLSPLDAATFALMSAILTAVALLASYLPARRAASANPMVTLRGD